MGGGGEGAADDGAGAALARLKWPLGLLLVTPVAPVLAWVADASPVWVFAWGGVAVVVLADWVRRATDQLALRIGPAIGGLLAITFGSIAEVMLAMFVLFEGKAEVVRAQLTGSIIGTSLLGLGVAVIVGAIGRDRQRFGRERAGLRSSLLILVMIALLMPSLFDLAQGAATPQLRFLSDEELSIAVSVVLLALYGANLVYTLVTHRDIFAQDEPAGGGEEPWPAWAAILVLLSATAVIGGEAEIVSGALEATAGALGLTQVFLGVIVLALVGTAADLVAAAWFARQDRLGLTMSICIGSAIQVALVVAPLLVLASWAIGKPMTLVFNSPMDLFAVAATAFIVNSIATDGETTWFEGVLLVGVYALLGLAYFFIA